MRFCDFFTSYKIGLKEIKITIPFIKFPLCIKIAIISSFLISIIIGILLILKFYAAALFTFIIGLILFAVFVFIDSKNGNLKTSLNDYYLPYSQKRMNMVINLLQQYKVDIHDISTIDLLIEDARTAQIQCDYLSLLKKPLKVLGSAIIPIIVYFLKKMGDNIAHNEMIILGTQIISIVLLIFSLIFALNIVVRDILYHDYNKYNELIYDLRQIKIFYNKKDCTSFKIYIN